MRTYDLCPLSLLFQSLALGPKSDLKDTVKIASALAPPEALPRLGISIGVLLHAGKASPATFDVVGRYIAFRAMKGKLV